MNRYSFSLTILSSLILLCCSKENTTDQQYKQSVNEWHAKRLERLTAPDSWLSLAGLYWLEEGDNSFGTDPENDLIFPEGTAPGIIGTFFREDSVITLRVNPDVAVFQDTMRVTGSLTLASDAGGNPTILSLGTLSWYVIQRGDRYGIRLKDSRNPNLLEFEGINRFPVDQKWNVQASFTPYKEEKTISIPTVLGTTVEEPCPGYLTFTIDDTEFRLEPIAERSSTRFFILFGDETNGESTYGAGRFLYIDAPDADGRTRIDFNMAYNPPCAFSAYATCPLPPLKNRLAVKITAGEKKYGRHHH